MTRRTHRALQMIGLALCVALLAMLTWARPAKDGSAAADAAIAEHREEIKMLRAAIDMCGGENAVAQDMGNGSWQCFTHQGRKTRVAEVAP